MGKWLKYEHAHYSIIYESNFPMLERKLNKLNYDTFMLWNNTLSLKSCFEAVLMIGICLGHSIMQNFKKQNTKLYTHYYSNYIPIMTHTPLRHTQTETSIEKGLEHTTLKWFLKIWIINIFVFLMQSILHLFPKFSWLRNLNCRENTFSSLFPKFFFAWHIYISLMDISI